MDESMTSSRPYLIRAIYDWIVDNDLTPHLLVDAGMPGTDVPRQYAQDGKIVLNIAPRAVRALDLGNQSVLFRARFGGSDTAITVPVGAVLAIYAQENGQGMAFETDAGGDAPPSGPTPDKDKASRPSLKVVK